MLSREDKERIDRYINGLVDEGEKDYVESLFLNGEINHDFRNSINKDWDLMLGNNTPDEINLSHLLDKVHHMIRKNETLKKQKPLQKFKRIYMKAAAIMLLPLLIAGGLIYMIMSNQNKIQPDQQVSCAIYAPMGARVSFNLPDGTKGMLNSGSRLIYNLPFTTNRQIKLEGEAFLKVSHNENYPFEIQAGNSTVEVLGTTLNVSAYPVENYIEVVLQEGEINFTDKKENEKVMLLPSERLVYENGKTTRSVVDPAKYNGWTEGKLIFRDDPMEEVARRIERWYNVEIELADPELLKYSFRATFKDDNLEDVIKFISMTSPIRFTITPRRLMPDGTYNKGRVIINKRNDNTDLRNREYERN